MSQPLPHSKCRPSTVFKATILPEKNRCNKHEKTYSNHANRNPSVKNCEDLIEPFSFAQYLRILRRYKPLIHHYSKTSSTHFSTKALERDLLFPTLICRVPSGDENSVDLFHSKKRRTVKNDKVKKCPKQRSKIPQTTVSSRYHLRKCNWNHF